MNNNSRLMFHIIGPYTIFSIVFSFFLPPIGFLMAFHGYRVDKIVGERTVGWIILMSISVCMTILFTIMIIFLIIYPYQEQNATTQYYALI